MCLKTIGTVFLAMNCDEKDTVIFDLILWEETRIEPIVAALKKGVLISFVADRHACILPLIFLRQFKIKEKIFVACLFNFNSLIGNAVVYFETFPNDRLANLY
jgi:hypothetical protein